MFPLVAKSGGVLMRSGHTEAAVDLARLAGEPPVGVIAELMNDKGAVMRGPEVLAFAHKHGFKIISVADLIGYRQSRERLVEQQAVFEVDTPIGKARGIAYATPYDSVQHLALIYGDISSGRDVPVRLHRENLVEDVFGGREMLNAVYAEFKAQERGLLVYLREGTAGVPAGVSRSRCAKSPAGRLPGKRPGGMSVSARKSCAISTFARSACLPAAAGISSDLSGFGIEISETVLLDS